MLYTQLLFSCPTYCRYVLSFSGWQAGRQAGRQARAHLNVGVLVGIGCLSSGAGLGVHQVAATVGVASRRRDLHEVDEQHLNFRVSIFNGGWEDVKPPWRASGQTSVLEGAQETLNTNGRKKKKGGTKPPSGLGRTTVGLQGAQVQGCCVFSSEGSSRHYTYLPALLDERPVFV